MGIFSTSAEVIKNKNNFKLWEEKQRLEQAKREKLNSSSEYSEEELEKARALGENIIGAIDVMDNHSESVAENVETATEPLVFLAPLLGGGLSAIASFKFLINPAAKKIDEIRRAELSTDSAKELYNKIKTSLDKDVRNFSLISKSDVKKIKDPTLRKQAENFYKNLSKKTSIYKKSYWAAGALFIGSILASFMGSIIAATKLQVNSSKVARFQARKQLEDPKYFVNYTPEQIAQAKADLEEAKNLEKQQKGLFKKRHKGEKSKLKQGLWGSLIGLIRDNKAYRVAKKQDNDESKIVTRELSSKELIQAEKDKEVIQRVVRVINNEAEKNSENMETAANVLIGGTPFLGVAVGSITSWILNKTGIVDKAVNKSIDKNASQMTKEFLNKYKEVLKKDSPKGIINKLKHFIEKQGYYFSYVGSMITDLELSQPIENGIRKPVKPSDYFKRGATAVMTSAKARNRIFSIAGGIMTGLAGLIIGLKLQKSAARAGRYTAKRDLEKDPRNFIGYTQDEYNEVQDVKPVKKESRFKEVTLFIPRVLKQYFAYNKYKKHEFKEKQELRKYLNNQEVSEQQLLEAQNLQRKVFNTFEKVDDNSQKYSESMEAAIEIAQPFVVFGGYLAAVTPFVLGALGLYKAKENPAKVIEKLTGWLKNSSKITNSKLVKKYLEGVSNNVAPVTSYINVEHKPLAHLLQGVDLHKDAKLDIVKKLIKNFKLSPEELRKLPPNEIENSIRQFYYSLKNIKIGEKSLIQFLEMDKYLEKILYMPTNLKLDALDIMLNPKNIKNISKENYDAILKIFAEKLETPKLIINTLLTEIPTKELKSIISKLKTIEGIEEVIGKELFEKLTKLINKLETPQNLTDDLVNSLTSQETISELVKGLNDLFSKLKNVPATLKNNKALEAIMQQEIEMPAEMLIALRKLSKPNGNSESYKQALIDIKNLLNNPSNTHRTFKTTIKGMIDEGKTSIHKVKSNIDLKKSIIKLKEQSEKTSPEQLDKIIKNIPYLKKLEGLDKDTLVKILGNLEKAIDNIPEAELEKIKHSMIEAFNKNPDEFVKMLRTGRITEVFLTPQLQRVLVVKACTV